MAIDAKRITNDLLKLIGSEYRSDLDENIHIVDVSYAAFKATDPKLNEETYLNIISSLADEFTTVNSVEDGMTMVKQSGNTVITDDNKYGTFIISKSYVPLQSKVANVIKRHTTLETGFIPVKSSISSNVNKVLAKLPLSASIPVIKNLYNLNNEYKEEVTFSSNINVDAFNKIIGSTTVQVNLSSATKSNKFAAAEKKMLARISNYLESKAFTDQLIKDSGLASVIEKNLAAAIEKKLVKPIKPKGTSGSSNQTKQGKGKLVVDKAPALRNKQGQFYSLASLLILLNTHLQDVISAKMGSGNETRVLNYRTGRFAASAEVQRLTQTKDGAITAFYDYMKYPYQTFEPGYKQGSPESRNPRLLISKSIHEIAATKVANRMRAVLV